MKTLWPYLRRFGKPAIIATIATIVLAFATLWQPRLLQSMMNAIIANDQKSVLHLGIWLVGLAVLGIAAGIVNTFYSAKTAVGVATTMRRDLYAQVQKFAFADIERFSASNLVVRMTNDVNQVQGMLMSVFQIVFRVPVLFVGALILALITIPRMWWVIVLMIVIVVLIAVFGTKKMGGLFAKVQADIDEVNTIARENLMGVRVVKSFNQEPQQIKQFTTASDRMVDITVKIGYTFSWMMPGFFLIANLTCVLVLLLVGRSIGAHPSDLAAVSSFISYVMQLLMAIINASFILTGATRAFVSLGRIGKVLDHEPSMVLPQGPEEKLTGSLEFNDVTFTYPGDTEPTLKDVSFSVKPGEMLGIVGATGSGKSTLAQLIPRLFDVDRGTIRIGGHDVRDLNAATLRGNVAMVLQRATLFSGTIANNLRQGKPDATLPDMRWAANVAQSAEFIDRLDAHYDAEVEERSANFSGGQKQRLAITRGVIGKPTILIMDDSTSALDARSERLVQDALNHELQDTTTVLIAEKLSAVIRADQILVVDHGEIVAAGTHAELVKTSPIYQEIYQTQRALEGSEAHA
ncbi:ABC transporter ATP-binding protein [Lacticaseibacillus porcinae]|uniref:ABC transporter ATP-binding protein n=1 Tax=Lacticaseibacillus porcinae TaxID=1123687 RepID=UPI000F76FDA0|nr:ABC transporter ATP-binding protein [Lacticaseibacillus porcinae]